MSSLNALLDAIRALYAWSARHDLYPAIGASVAWQPYARDAQLPVLGRAQLGSLLAHLPAAGLHALRDRALVLLLLETGIATISAHRADWRHLDLQTQVLIHQPQGHRQADVRQAFGPATTLALQRYRAGLGRPLPGDPLFVRIRQNQRPGSRLSTLSMRLTVLRLMERAGFAQRDRSGRLLEPGAYSASCLRRSARARQET